MDNFDDILFEKKNKDYGTYILRKKYFSHVSIGLFFVIAIFVSVSVYAYILCLKYANDASDDELKQAMVEFEQFDVLKNIDSIQISQPSPQKKEIKKEEQNLVVVDSLKPEADTLKVIKLPDNKTDSNTTKNLASDTSRNGSVNGSGTGIVYTMVDELPEFPGGFSALKQYLLKNTVYPEFARKNNIKGAVQVQFIITRSGTVEKVTIKKSANPLLDVESMRVVNSFPTWKPATRKGKPVNVWCVIPFNYQL